MDLVLGVGEMGFIFCGKHPLLLIRIQVRNPGPNVPLVFVLANSVDPNEITYSKTCLKWPLKQNTKNWFSTPVIA